MTLQDLATRPLSPAQLEGFQLACAGMAQFGRQIEARSIALGGPQPMVPQHQVTRHGARMLQACAEALSLAATHDFRLAVNLTALEP